MLARILIFTLGLGGVGAAQTVTVAVSPTTATNRVGETRTFTATVRNTANTAVNWTTTAGTITSAGVFTAPATLPLGGLATVRATSVADPTKVATADVTLQNARPTITALNPTSVNTGMPYTLLIKGTNFLPTSTVTLEGVAAAVTYIGPTDLQVSEVATNLPGNAIDVIVSNPDPGASSSAMVGVTVLAAVRVTVNPTGATIAGGASLRFTAAVANTSVTTVSWFVNGMPGGNPQVGLIDGAGQYTAPAAPPAGGRVEIKAVSAFDGRAEGIVTATIQNGVPVLSGVTPDTVTVGAHLVGVLPFNSSLLVPQAGPGGATFTVTGSLFAPTARVFLGGRELSTTYVSSTQLRAMGT
ncbi:MAG: IPT/TIG domain-containing protein, partial [Acidobacteria bacterium]|nr:IPT/TIG domain-containing protein [Acidobacteriota bacterium]